MDFTKIFNEISKNAIKLDFSTGAGSELKIGSSKLGGKPDLPKDFRWPYFKGEGFDGEIKNRPLHFLFQVDCSETESFDSENILPKQGMLYFFYEMTAMPWGFDPKDKGSAKVYYYNCEKHMLHRHDFPNDTKDGIEIPERAVKFSRKTDLPDFDEYSETHDFDDYDKYDGQKAAFGYQEEETISKLLGYADILQNSLLLECEKVTNGIYCGEPAEIEEKRLIILKNNAKDWVLLFQLDSIWENNRDLLMFGDCGRIYYYIKKEDLKNLNFNNCWMILQCC